MNFENYEDRLNYLYSYGIKEGDEIVVVSDEELNGKIGEVIQVRVGFCGPLYNIKFHDGYGNIRDNRFQRKNIELNKC